MSTTLSLKREWSKVSHGILKFKITSNEDQSLMRKDWNPSAYCSSDILLPRQNYSATHTTTTLSTNPDVWPPRPCNYGFQKASVKSCLVIICSIKLSISRKDAFSLPWMVSKRERIDLLISSTTARHSNGRESSVKSSKSWVRELNQSIIRTKRRQSTSKDTESYQTLIWPFIRQLILWKLRKKSKRSSKSREWADFWMCGILHCLVFKWTEKLSSICWAREYRQWWELGNTKHLL